MRIHRRGPHTAAEATKSGSWWSGSPLAMTTPPCHLSALDTTVLADMVGYSAPHSGPLSYPDVSYIAIPSHTLPSRDLQVVLFPDGTTALLSHHGWLGDRISPVAYKLQDFVFIHDNRNSGEAAGAPNKSWADPILSQQAEACHCSHICESLGLGC